MLDMQSEPFVIGGQKIVNVNISNDAVIFLKECVNGFIDGKFGDHEDPRQKKLGQELKEDLHQVWKALNPS
jgi:hypothetical protein